MTAYYNEIDPGAAATLRELIAAKMIAPGDVDERSIEDVLPTDLLGYSQCHFFAGIGVWSYALRLAGWPDDRPVWTGSCPCQPFSAAGKGEGFADERHLWPAFHWLIRQCQPVAVFGEQVAGKDGLGWLDLVSADLEALGYACGAVPFPAAGIGAPHIRERLYWVADTEGDRRADGASKRRGSRQVSAKTAEVVGTRDCGAFGGLEVAHLQRRDGIDALLRQDAGRGARDIPEAPRRGEAGRVADDQLQQRQIAPPRGDEARGRQQEPAEAAGLRRNSWPGPTNGHWRDADWLGCQDGFWRPVEPSTFPLAHGAAARVGRLRGYGNAIVAQQAQAFIESYLEVRAAA